MNESDLTLALAEALAAADPNRDPSLTTWEKAQGMMKALAVKGLRITAEPTPDRAIAAINALPFIVREMTPGERPMTTVVSRQAVLDILTPR